MKFLFMVLAIFLASNSKGDQKSWKKNLNFDGYIVRTDNKMGHKAISLLKNLGRIEKFSLGTGDIYHFSPHKNLDHKMDKAFFQKLSGVTNVEPNSIVFPLDHEVPRNPPAYIKDVKFRYQWGFRNSGHNNWRGEKAGIDFSAVEAWKIPVDSKDMIIAIIDSGIDPTHPDLINNLWVNQLEKEGKPGIDDDNNGYVDDIYGYNFHKNTGSPMDGLGHGLAVSGVIGASHNTIGIRGVMPHVKIMSLKFLSDTGPGYKINAIRAIDYAIKHGAKIINNSWGSNKKSAELLKMIQYANEKNVVFVAAAGNINENNDPEGRKREYPASYDVPNIISVGSHNAYDKKSSFSNYGKNFVHIFAPGFRIMSTAKDHQYKSKSGTSLSAPAVSGAIGLLWSKYPSLSIKDIKNRLIETSITNENYRKYGVGGRLDIERLLLHITN